jgi:hypothetical protein
MKGMGESLWASLETGLLPVFRSTGNGSSIKRLSSRINAHLLVFTPSFRSQAVLNSFGVA